MPSRGRQRRAMKMTTGLEHLLLCREEEGAGGIQPGEEKATGRSHCSLLILERSL